MILTIIVPWSSSVKLSRLISGVSSILANCEIVVDFTISAKNYVFDLKNPDERVYRLIL
jgi:hypothetical protein